MSLQLERHEIALAGNGFGGSADWEQLRSAANSAWNREFKSLQARFGKKRIPDSACQRLWAIGRILARANAQWEVTLLRPNRRQESRALRIAMSRAIRRARHPMASSHTLRQR